jgi:hypothetical protein
MASRVVQELVSSEESYLSMLHHLRLGFFLPFLERLPGHEVVTKAIAQVPNFSASTSLYLSFLQLEMIISLHERIAPLLRACSSANEAANFFLKHADFLKIYASYLQILPVLFAAEVSITF